MKFTSDDHARIAAAIARAEVATSGEIFCVFSRQVSAYRDVALSWAAGAALILPLALIPFGFDLRWLPWSGGGWEAAHIASRDAVVGGSLTAYALFQLLIFLLVWGLSAIPAIRRLLTPAALRARRVHAAAMQQFLAHGLHTTQDRTGVLIFAALSDHRVEVVADQGIHAKVSQEVWADAAEALARAMKAGRPADGFEQAIGLCGAVLAEHFPPRATNPNEIADKLIEL